MERDLQFVPADPDRARTLSREQVEHYNDRGYVFAVTIFDDDEADANRRYFDMLIEQIRRADDGRDAYSINGYQVTCRGLYDLCRHPHILDLVEDIVGPDIICWGTHYFCKMPGDPKRVSWHQDAPYWPLTPSNTVTVWLAIDDADRTNAAMRVIPGTHQLGALENRDSDAGEQNVLNNTDPKNS